MSRVPASDFGVPTIVSPPTRTTARRTNGPGRLVDVPTAELGQLTEPHRAPGCQQRHGLTLLRHRRNDHLELLERQRLDLVYAHRVAGTAEDLEDLAASWAGRQILYPMSLRVFVESKRAWYPSLLAQRMGTSEVAARRLLEAVGYRPSPRDHDLMEYSEGHDAQAARQLWSDAEWQPTFTSISELLESDSSRPELPTDHQYAYPSVGWRSLAHVRHWLVTLVSRRRE